MLGLKLRELFFGANYLNPTIDTALRRDRLESLQ